MTSEELIELLSVELTRIKREATNLNIGLRFYLNGGKTIELHMDEQRKWYKNPEILDGCLKIADIDKSLVNSTTTYNGSAYVVTTKQPLVIRYIPVESIVELEYFFDSVTTTNVELPDSGGDEPGE